MVRLVLMATALVFLFLSGITQAQIIWTGSLPNPDVQGYVFKYTDDLVVGSSIELSDAIYTSGCGKKVQISPTKKFVYNGSPILEEVEYAYAGTGPQDLVIPVSATLEARPRPKLIDAKHTDVAREIRVAFSSPVASEAPADSTGGQTLINARYFDLAEITPSSLALRLVRADGTTPDITVKPTTVIPESTGSGISSTSSYKVKYEFRQVSNDALVAQPLLFDDYRIEVAVNSAACFDRAYPNKNVSNSNKIVIPLKEAGCLASFDRGIVWEGKPNGVKSQINCMSNNPAKRAEIITRQCSATGTWEQASVGTCTECSNVFRVSGSWVQVCEASDNFDVFQFNTPSPATLQSPATFSMFANSTTTGNHWAMYTSVGRNKGYLGFPLTQQVNSPKTGSSLITYNNGFTICTGTLNTPKACQLGSGSATLFMDPIPAVNTPRTVTGAFNIVYTEYSEPASNKKVLRVVNPDLQSFVLPPSVYAAVKTRSDSIGDVMSYTEVRINALRSGAVVVGAKGVLFMANSTADHSVVFEPRMANYYKQQGGIFGSYGLPISYDSTTLTFNTGSQLVSTRNGLRECTPDVAGGANRCVSITNDATSSPPPEETLRTIRRTLTDSDAFSLKPGEAIVGMIGGEPGFYVRPNTSTESYWVWTPNTKLTKLIPPANRGGMLVGDRGYVRVGRRSMGTNVLSFPAIVNDGFAFVGFVDKDFSIGWYTPTVSTDSTRRLWKLPTTSAGHTATSGPVTPGAGAIDQDPSWRYRADVKVDQAGARARLRAGEAIFAFGPESGPNTLGPMFYWKTPSGSLAWYSFASNKAGKD